MIGLKKFPNYKHYIVYICSSHEHTPVVNYFLNGQITEYILTKNFLYIPILENESNEIEISLNFKNFDKFRAIPFGIVRMWPDLQEKVFFTNLKKPNWLESIHGCERLEGLEPNKFSISLNLNMQKGESFWQHKSTNGQKEIYLESYSLGTPSFDYTDNSWMVGYSSKKLKHVPYLVPKYRIDKQIHINCSSVLNTSNLYNYVMIGQKTIPMNKVNVIRKIQTIIDWVNAFNEILAISHTVSVDK